MSKYKKLLKLVVLYVSYNMVAVSSAQIFPKSPEPWREEYNISLSGFKFSHPMTVLNQEDLQKIRNRIADNVEPQKSAFENLLVEASLQLSFTPDAPRVMDIMGGYEPNSNLSEMREWLWRNCHAAYTCGLAYALTDETVYAAKAKEVLMNWANTGTIFTGGDRGLQLGSWFSPMLYAADLIYGYEGWTEEERDTFKIWWRNNCIISGDVLDVMRRKDNNWKDAGILGVMAASVILEDTLYLKEALIQLKSYFFSRTDEYVQLPGPGWKIKKDGNGIYLPREVVRNDGSSGLTYTAYALTTMVQCLEIARYAGFDFWQFSTEEGANITDVINQYFAWDIKNESFPWNTNPNKTDKRRNSYELAHTFLEADPDLKTWVRDNWPQLNGREGDEYCTLNKGDLAGTGIIPPEAPGDLSASAFSDRQINLVWRDNSLNESGFNISRKTAGGSYFLLASVDSNITSFKDTYFLNESTTYIYRVRAYKEFAYSDFSNEATAATLEKDHFLYVAGPSDDAFIQGGANADKNFGNEPELAVKNGATPDSVAKIFIKFSTGGQNPDKIKSGLLRLHNTSISQLNVQITQTSDNWNENDLTWNNAPVPLGDSNDTLYSVGERYFEWNVTSILKEELQSDSSVSFILYGDTSSVGQIIFSSKEAGSYIPELRIVYYDSTLMNIISKNEWLIPNEINLKQNYPNPFNPSTTIAFMLPKSEFVTLKIYNILGEEVETVVNEKLNAGNHTYIFNGYHLSSGIYLYRIGAGDFQEVRKMALIK